MNYSEYVQAKKCLKQIVKIQETHQYLFTFLDGQNKNEMNYN
jgi:hypothetical protein